MRQEDGQGRGGTQVRARPANSRNDRKVDYKAASERTVEAHASLESTVREAVKLVLESTVRT